MIILVLNAGSSSLKFKLFDMEGSERVLAEGNCQRVGLEEGEISFAGTDGKKLKLPRRLKNHKEALDVVLRLLTQGEAKALDSIEELRAVGHRVSMGGPTLMSSTLLSEETDAVIEEVGVATPLHTPPQMATIRACRALLGKDFPQVAAFDTAFHATVPQIAFMTSAPYEFYEKYGMRRFGFHGLSHNYVSGRYQELSGNLLSRQCIITCHLGGGSSVTGIKNAVAVDNSFGFGTGEGPMCGTRAGTFDHGAIQYIIRKNPELTYEDIEHILNFKSGLLGISGLSSDERELEEAAAAGHARAQLALDMMVYHVRRYIGAYAFVMGGLDAVVFTGGIGENSDYVRSRVCEGLERFGVEPDGELNRLYNRKEGRFSKEGSGVELWIIPTNEELVIARDTVDIVLKAGR